uniref:Uncharacterized protein n=1 Tax=Timema poppense TaxID=170557 RepID=A0A7R9GS39_TIMPO|nr:unnamed protein product [Timema poppensis]
MNIGTRGCVRLKISALLPSDHPVVTRLIHETHVRANHVGVQGLLIMLRERCRICEWLLGERRPSLEDMDVGLDPQGAIYKAIMANPTIQLSLNNPKILLAFLSMLENPSCANMWINDPDASPILSQIFKTYHAEKHALQMNLLVELQQQTLNHT